MSASEWPVVIVESPFAGDIEGNRQYAIEACLDCFRRSEIPFASHLIYPQMLDELEQSQRNLGIHAGYAFWKVASKIVFYIDRGMSSGMQVAKERAIFMNIPYEERRLEK